MYNFFLLGYVSYMDSSKQYGCKSVHRSADS